MGNTNKLPKDPKETSDTASIEKPRRRSIRKSLRLSKSSSKDVLASTEKYFQILNGEFEKGHIYNVALEELKKIDAEIEKLLTDLTNLADIGLNTAKRCELENSARYFRNKIKSAIDSHMNSAIHRLNQSFSQEADFTNIIEEDVEPTGAIEDQNTQNNNGSPTRIETSKEKIAAKLREVSIKIREVLNLLDSMNEIDDITKNSATYIIETCKRELYNIQTKNEKLINKKWKCFRKLDEIKQILDGKNASKISEEKTEPRISKFAATVGIESSTVPETTYSEETEDANAIDGDIEDNTEKLPVKQKSLLPEESTNAKNNNSLEVNGTGSKISDDVSEPENCNELKEIKMKIKKIHSFVLSLETVDEITKNSTVDALKKCRSELRNLQVNSGNLIKKKIRCLKRIEEINAVLHNKYCEDSDEDTSICTDDGQAKIKYQRVISELSTQGNNENGKPKDNIKFPENAIEKSIQSENKIGSQTKRLSANFEFTRSKIDEIFLTRSVNFHDLEALSEGINKINEEFNNILQEVCDIQNKSSSKDTAIRENIGDKGHICLQIQAKSEPKLISNRTSNIQINLVSPKVTTENAISPKKNEELKGEKPRNRVNSEILQASDKTKSKINSNGKEYKQALSVDELDKSQNTEITSKRHSEQNLNKIAQKPASNLISMRNIDMSQLVTKDSRISSLSELEGKPTQHSVTTRNLDLSQVSYRDSDMSLTEFITRTYDDHFSDVFTSQNSETNAAGDSSGEDGGITIITPKQINFPLENVTKPSSVNSEKCNSGNAEGTIADALAEITKELEILKEQIMNFVGLKTDDTYNELDEKLVNIMVTIDALQIQENSPSYVLKQKLVGDVYRFSGMLEMKNLDHDYLDSCDKEIKFVEKEVRQSLANEKLGNLQNIMKDLEEMIAELDTKIVDHLLIDRKDGCIKKLNALKEKLKVFTK